MLKELFKKTTRISPDSVAQPAPALHELSLGDLDQLKEDLGKWVLEDDPHKELINYLQEDFFRFCYTLHLVPQEEGKLLELGANPYFTTRLLKCLRNYELTLANYFGQTTSTQAIQKAFHKDTQEEEVFTFDLFNSEKDRFPYEDESFDVTLYCEILEHLTNDPVAVISELSRTLKTGGHLILTTPNVGRMSNIIRMLKGQSIYDPYSGYGPYGRHNREYTISEVQHLLALNGFAIEEGFTATVTPRWLTTQNRWAIRVLQFFIGRPHDLGEYTFIRAKKIAPCPEKRSSHIYRSRTDLVAE